MVTINKDLIVRALKHYHDSKFTPGVYEHSIFGQAALLLEMDAVPVVRCKECKYGRYTEEIGMWECLYHCEFDHDLCTHFGFTEYNEEDHFCARGERRNNEKEVD